MSRSKTVAFFTLGCKVNQYESARLAEKLSASGFSVVKTEDIADIYIVNTCTVTALADRKSRNYIRRVKRLNPDATIAVMGCYPETNRAAVEALPEADIILGTRDKDDIVKILCENVPDSDFKPVSDPDSATRAMIKIEDGCDRFCSYCVIPFARHEVRSVPLEQIINEAKLLIAKGYKEIVVTGINTALYGKDCGKSIEDVIAALNGLEGDFRIRLGSLEPTVINADLVKQLFRYDKLCHHLHLSVQSGSDRIIRAMNRNYTVDEYMNIVNAVREFDPLYGLTTDIICGFPGESDEDFNESIKLAEKADFLKVHGFPYSVRPFTAAADMPDQIPPYIKKQRNKTLIDFADKISLNFRSKMTGTVQKVLTEEKVQLSGKTYMKGHADNFCPVYIEATDGKYPDENTFVNVIINETAEDGCTGKEV